VKLLSLKRNVFFIVLALFLILIFLLPTVSSGSTQVQASSTQTQALTDPYTPATNYLNCSQCHSRFLPAIPTFTAATTINMTLCRACHDTVDFGTLTTNYTIVHASHLGLIGSARPADGSLGNASKMPTSAANLINPPTTNMKDCAACHRSLSGGLPGYNCTACHSPALAGHIKALVQQNCSNCHGVLPNVATHNVTIANGVHSIFGTVPVACFVCHYNSTTGISGLRLVNGTVIPISEPSLLCAQCHSDYYQLWLEGKHGDPTKQCTDPSCHDPHNPYIPPVVAVVPAPSVWTSWWFLLSVAIIIVVIIAVAIYLIRRK